MSDKAEMSQFSSESFLNEVEAAVWPAIKEKLRGPVWAWYDAHKDQQITTILKVFHVTISSFGIAEAVITNVIGPRPA